MVFLLDNLEESASTIGLKKKLFASSLQQLVERRAFVKKIGLCDAFVCT
jgi:hypothetical protein